MIETLQALAIKMTCKLLQMNVYGLLSEQRFIYHTKSLNSYSEKVTLTICSNMIFIQKQF